MPTGNQSTDLEMVVVHGRCLFNKKKVFWVLFSVSHLTHLSSPSDGLLPSSHPADEDEPNLLLVPGIPVLSALGPPGGAVPAQHRRPPVRHGHQRLRGGHGREEQLLRGVSHQLDGQIRDSTLSDLGRKASVWKNLLPPLDPSLQGTQMKNCSK